jgi:arylsulfatase A-like enzyme
VPGVLGRPRGDHADVVERRDLAAEQPCQNPVTTIGSSQSKLNHYYERIDEWDAQHGVPAAAAPAAESFWELHNLTTDPEERKNFAGERSDALADTRELMKVERDAKRLVPSLRERSRGLTNK